MDRPPSLWQPPDSLRRHFVGVDTDRASAIVFPARGQRSLPDEMDGGDLDGDDFALIWNASLLAAFPPTSLRAWGPDEERELLGTVPSSKPAQKTPASDESRRDAAAWHMVRTRHGQAAKGKFANQWVLVAERYGGNDRRARKLAYLYPAALDAAKAGASPEDLPVDCQLAEYPSHLASHYPHRKQEMFTARRDTALARLGALQMSCSMPECRVPDDCFQLVHPDYSLVSGARSQTFRTILEKWEERYKQCREELKGLPGTSWEDPERLRTMNDIFEKYRYMLLEGYSDEQYVKW